MMNDETFSGVCASCPRELRDHEAGRYICTPCEQRIDQYLRQLPGPRGLYARACLRVHRDRRGDGTVVSGTPGLHIPPNEDALSFTANGGMVSTLEGWVDDWAERGYATASHGGRLQYRVDRAVETLCFNLNRAASMHPALDDFAREVFRIRATAEAIITGERAERPIAVACPCGATLRITVSTPGVRCYGCSTQYARGEVFDLPLASRATGQAGAAA